MTEMSVWKDATDAWIDKFKLQTQLWLQI